MGALCRSTFKKGDVVAEYVGEYISNAVADAREKMYQDAAFKTINFGR
jgi:SET domain-containing protein